MSVRPSGRSVRHAVRCFHHIPRIALVTAGSAMPPFGLAWSVPGADPEVRHRFSLNTCNGCHAGETQTPLLHVFPRAAGGPSVLSPFLIGTQPVPDPFTGMPRVFDELGPTG